MVNAFTISDEAVNEQTHVIKVGGEVDINTAPALKQRIVEIIEEDKQHIIVDFSEATFIDSTTLGILVGGVKRLRPSGGWLSLVCTDENILKVLHITGLDQIFPIESSIEAALSAQAGKTL
jgi:anti-sigma B factor antagonist